MVIATANICTTRFLRLFASTGKKTRKTKQLHTDHITATGLKECGRKPQLRAIIDKVQSVNRHAIIYPKISYDER